MALLALKSNPSSKDLRWFAGLWFPAFWAVIGLLTWRRHDAAFAVAIWSIAGALAICGFQAPRVIRPSYFVMTRASYPLGWVMSNIFMILTYFVIFTAVGWLMRRFHDPMQRKFDGGVESYWIPWESGDPDQYFRQT